MYNNSHRRNLRLPVAPRWSSKVASHGLTSPTGRIGDHTESYGLLITTNPSIEQDPPLPPGMVLGRYILYSNYTLSIALFPSLISPSPGHLHVLPTFYFRHSVQKTPKRTQIQALSPRSESRMLEELTDFIFFLLYYHPTRAIFPLRPPAFVSPDPPPSLPQRSPQNYSIELDWSPSWLHPIL